MLGKLFISVTFSCVYVHSSELFPTEVRSVGVGTASMCARISSMAAAYVGGPLVSRFVLLQYRGQWWRHWLVTTFVALN